MTWQTVLAYLPDALCFIACVVGCLCSSVGQGKLKKYIASFCPSWEPVNDLTKRVDDLQARLDALGQVVTDVLEDKGG